MFGLVTALTMSANTYYQTQKLFSAEIEGVSEQMFLSSRVNYERS
jgi:hypothetical protein